MSFASFYIDFHYPNGSWIDDLKASRQIGNSRYLYISHLFRTNQMICFEGDTPKSSLLKKTTKKPAYNMFFRRFPHFIFELTAIIFLNHGLLFPLFHSAIFFEYCYFHNLQHKHFRTGSLFSLSKVIMDY